MSSGVKRQRQPAASSNAESSKKRRTQTRAAPKSRGPYRFTFGKFKGKTIQEAYDEDYDYIEDFIVFKGMTGRNDILKNNPALRAGLRDLPKSWLERNSSLERLLDNDQPGGPSIYEYEAMVPNQGMMKMNERSSSCRFWEATDGAVVSASHQSAPTVKLEDFAEALDDSHFTKRLSPIHIAFTATVIRVERSFTDFGMGGSDFDPFKILPCGWPWESPLSTEVNVAITGQDTVWAENLKPLVYGHYRFSGSLGTGSSPPTGWPKSLDVLKDPETVEPSSGCCFRIAGKVKKVDGRSVKVSVKREKARYADGWEKDVTVELSEGVQEPELDASYVFNGLLEPFTKVFKDIKFIVETCNRTGKTPS
ncbi:hypothetical protein J4E83_007761 [Alternaria metachromatica]|uniref:uncharacterized protein n=1 Tax=Alternaria metachromatica TaxID=283354 RepID=UPI0020C5179D|nr:uncharacterized protein J4E83_007761 [Alternaria metachromatica]KAI4612209.1 hypothetical protein J4E83_007761 [Alternaria metachromatica]